MEKGKFFKIVDRIEDICLVSMFALMVATIFLQVIMRYCFNNSLVWSEELGKFLFVWLSWFGLSIGERRNEHIKITMLTDKFSPLIQKIFEIISYLVLLIILVVTVYYAVELVEFQMNVQYAGIKVSTSWGYLSLVVGCGFMILRVLGVLARNVKAILEKDFSRSAHPGMIDQVEAALEIGKQEFEKGGEE